MVIICCLITTVFTSKVLMSPETIYTFIKFPYVHHVCTNVSQDLVAIKSKSNQIMFILL